MPYKGHVAAIDIDKPRTVIGDGEYLYLPFLIAELAEKRGGEVLFQSTTRSPVMVGNGIQTKRSFKVDHRDIEHYIYNLQDSNRLPIHLLEDESSRSSNELAVLFSPLKGEELS
ncbi:TRSP domain-containing protein [Vibrio mexicanus]|uniref:TRSP domain-containing protein n=1 Tax=Vibrio mexicanus TaxID=1004326 RepID=UPI003B50A69A